MASGSVHAIAHCCDFHSRFACRGPASGNGMANDNRTGCARILPGVVVRAVVNDNQQVNAWDCAACTNS